MANITPLNGGMKLPQAWPIIDDNVRKVNAEVVAHVDDTKAHAAEHIEVVNVEGAGNVAEAFDKQRQRIDNIVAQSGNDITEIVDAREDYGTLRERLDTEKTAVMSQLADKTTEISDLGMVKADKIFVTEGLAQKANTSEVRKKTVKLELEDMSATTLAAIQGGDGTSFNILSIPQDKSVTAVKTNFIKAGKNKYLGGYANGHFTGAVPYTFLESTGKIAILELEPNKTYTITKSNDTDRFRIALSSIYPTNNTVVTSNSTFINDATTPKTVTTADEEVYLLVYVSSTTQSLEPSWLQVEEGGIATEYSDAIVINLDEKSLPIIKPEKTTFIERSNKNLFNGEFYNKTYLSNTTGAIITSSDGSQRTTKRIRVDGGKYYTISGSDRNVFRFEGKDNNFLYYANNKTALAPANAYYMMVYYTNDGTAEKVQIEEGQSVTEYEKPYKFSELINQGVAVMDLEFIESSKNLFNGEYINATISGASETGFTITDSPNGKTAILRLEPNKKYTMSKSEDTNRFRWVLYNSYPINGAKSYIGLDLLNSTTSKTITTNNEDIYLAVYVSTNDEGKIPSWLQVEEGGIATPYKAPYRIKEEYLRGDKPTFYIVGDNGDNYTSTSETINVSSLGNDVDNLYTIFDNLVALFPDYITKSLAATTTTGLPIYQYEFIPRKPKGTIAVNFPKMLYIGGTHGMEKYAMADGAKFFIDLAKNWTTNKVLQVLRANVHFIVIPCLNPYGFNNNQRTNANGVDLNRNFPNGFTPATAETDPNYYPGTAPLSEIETQLINSVLTENDDIVFSVDHHNYNAYPASADDIFYMASTNDNVLRILTGLCHYLNMKVKSDYAYIPKNNENLMRVLKQSPAGRMSDFFESKGIPGSLFEAVISIGGTEEDLHKIGSEGVGNLMLSAVRNLDRVK